MKKRILAMAMAAAMALTMAVTASAEGVTKSIQLDGATFTLTANAIADGEEITITASGMEDGYDTWSFFIHPVKDGLEYFSAVLEDGQTDFYSRSAVMDVMEDWQAGGLLMEPNTSRTFTLLIPEEFEGWAIDVRIAGKAPGSYSTNVDPLILFEEEKVEEPVAVSFTDVSESDWFYRFVTVAVSANQMSGMGDGIFDPNGNLTVAQVLSLAARTDMRTKGISSLPASDGPWYAPFASYCVENGIVAAGQFSEEDMNRPATRYEMAAILDAASDESVTSLPINDVPNGFIPDVNEEDPYGEVIYKWYRAGITTGFEDHSYHGEQTITRAQTAVILCHLSNLVERAVIQ